MLCLFVCRYTMYSSTNYCTALHLHHKKLFHQGMSNSKLHKGFPASVSSFHFCLTGYPCDVSARTKLARRDRSFQSICTKPK